MWHQCTSSQSLFLGLVRPLTPLELCLESFKFGQCSYFSIVYAALSLDVSLLRVEETVEAVQGQERQHSSARAARLSVGFVSSAATWDAHEDPVYGYTNTVFDYKPAVHLVRDIAMHSYKEGTTRAEMGHLKYWHSFCGICGLRHWRDDWEANSGKNIAGYEREVGTLTSFALDTAKIMSGRRGRKAGLLVRGVRRAHEKLIPPAHMVPTKAVSTTLNVINQ